MGKGIPFWASAPAVWVVTHPFEAFTYGVALRYATVPTVKVTWLVAKELTPAVGRIGWGIVGRGGILAMHFPRVYAAGIYGAAAVVGAGIGAAAGVIISGIFWGDEGAEDARDLYMGRVSWSEYKSTVGGALRQTF